jgi:multidrug efflux system membrane fusion protein
VIVPAAAVRHGPESDFVYVVKSDDTVELRNVKVGTVEGERALIESGVAEGETLVTQGLDRLKPGTKVEGRSATKEGKGEGSGRRGKAGAVGRGGKGPDGKSKAESPSGGKKP